MATENFGLKIGLEGEKEFKAQLAEINQTFKVLGSEMKLVDSQFEKNDKSVQALTSRNTTLEKSIDTQKLKIQTLKTALDNASTSFGENDRRTQNWQIQLNNAQAELNGMQKELKQNNEALKTANENMDEAGDSAKDMGKDVKESGEKADDASSKFKALGTVCKAAGVAMAAAFAAVTAAAVQAGKALVEMAVEGASYADTVLTESTVTGISTEKLQEYMYAAELVDVSVETLTGSMKKNISSMKSAADGSTTYAEAYEKLGISVTDADGNLRDSDEVFWELIEALGNVENDTERDALAMTLLGKSAQDLNPLIEAGSEKMKELGEQAEEAGYILSDEMLAAYGALDDQIQYLKNGLSALKNALGTILLPVLTELATDGVSLLSELTKGIRDCNGDVSKMGDVISTVLPKFLNMILKYVPDVAKIALSIVQSLAGSISSNLDMIIDTAGEIIFTLLDGLITAVPKIAEGALKIVDKLVTGLLENLPKIGEAAITLIVTLANGISKSLPKLVPTVVKVITEIVKTLTTNLPLILNAALELIKGLAEGLIEAIPVLIEALPDIITSIVEFLVDSIPQIIETGIELFVSLVEALPTIIEAIVAAIPKIIDSVISAVIGAIPQIIEAGIKLFISLIENLPTIIETIVLAIPTIIEAIVNALVGNIDKIIDAGVQLFIALIKNLPTIIIEVVKAVPQIISSLVSAFGEGVGKMAEVGQNLVRGLWQGIQSLATWIWDKVSDWASNLWEGLKSFFGIHSPSKKMAWIGDMLMEGMAKGIDENASEAVDSAENMVNELNDTLNEVKGNAEMKFKANYDVVKPTPVALTGLSDIYPTLRNSLLNGLGSLNITGDGTQNIEVSVPVYLDGEEITTITSKIQSGRNLSLKRAMGV